MPTYTDIFGRLDWLTKTVKRLCCSVDKLKESGAGSYKVYTALLTQSGGNSDQYTSNGNLILGVTYTITTNDDNLANWTNVGAPNNNIGTSFVATGTTPISWGSNSELEYNTGAPVVKVLENTIGNIWFIYEDPGVYQVHTDGNFNINKTTVFIGGGQNYTNMSITKVLNGGIMSIQTIDINSSGNNQLENNILLNTPIEIRVYN